MLRCSFVGSLISCNSRDKNVHSSSLPRAVLNVLPVTLLTNRDGEYLRTSSKLSLDKFGGFPFLL
jgi:hypothetical protein